MELLKANFGWWVSQPASQPQTCILSSATRTKNHEKLFFLGGSTRQAVHRLTGVLHWDSCLPGHTIFQQISIVQVSGIPSFILFLKSPLSILTWLNWAQLELSLAQLSPSLFTLLKILLKYLSNLHILRAGSSNDNLWVISQKAPTVSWEGLACRQSVRWNLLKKQVLSRSSRLGFGPCLTKLIF